MRARSTFDTAMHILVLTNSSKSMSAFAWMPSDLAYLVTAKRPKQSPSTFLSHAALQRMRPNIRPILPGISPNIDRATVPRHARRGAFGTGSGGCYRLHCCRDVVPAARVRRHVDAILGGVAIHPRTLVSCHLRSRAARWAGEAALKLHAIRRFLLRHIDACDIACYRYRRWLHIGRR